MSEPILSLCIEFEGQEKAWTYPMALNGRTVARVSLDGVQYVPHEHRDSLIRSMLLTLVQSAAGNIDPRELNFKIADYADRMEALGVI